jgi:uncharacterized protein YuzE
VTFQQQLGLLQSKGSHKLSEQVDNTPRIEYDAETDTITIVLEVGIIEASDEESAGMIIDRDCEGKIISLELLAVSKLMGQKNTGV